MSLRSLVKSERRKGVKQVQNMNEGRSAKTDRATKEGGTKAILEAELMQQKESTIIVV